MYEIEIRRKTMLSVISGIVSSVIATIIGALLVLLFSPKIIRFIKKTYMQRKYAAPQRLMDNLKKNSYGVNQGYARYYTYPSSKSELQRWIEDAHKARINRASLIYNGRPMMKYNSKCRFHDITH